MTFEIWAEGYLATGMEGMPQRAFRMGIGKGKTFKEACEHYFWYDRPMRDKNFDNKTMTYWGCRLFDNEADARKSFG